MGGWQLISHFQHKVPSRPHVFQKLWHLLAVQPNDHTPGVRQVVNVRFPKGSHLAKQQGTVEQPHLLVLWIISGSIDVLQALNAQVRLQSLPGRIFAQLTSIKIYRKQFSENSQATVGK